MVHFQGTEDSSNSKHTRHRRRRRYASDVHTLDEAAYAKMAAGGGVGHGKQQQSGAHDDAWKDLVQSKLVADAWELLCGSIIQEVGCGMCGGMWLVVWWKGLHDGM